MNSIERMSKINNSWKRAIASYYVGRVRNSVVRYIEGREEFTHHLMLCVCHEMYIQAAKRCSSADEYYEVLYTMNSSSELQKVIDYAIERNQNYYFSDEEYSLYLAAYIIGIHESCSPLLLQVCVAATGSNSLCTSPITVRTFMIDVIRGAALKTVDLIYRLGPDVQSINNIDHVAYISAKLSSIFKLSSKNFVQRESSEFIIEFLTISTKEYLKDKKRRKK